MDGLRGVWVQDSELEPPHFSPVKFCQLSQQSFAFWKQEYLHDPVVSCRWTLANESPALGPLNKSHNGVVAFLQKFGQFSDSGGAPLCEPCNTQKQLVLLGSKAL